MIKTERERKREREREREREIERERDRKYVYQDGTAFGPIEKVLVSEIFIPFIGSQ